MYLNASVLSRRKEDLSSLSYPLLLSNLDSHGPETWMAVPLHRFDSVGSGLY